MASGKDMATNPGAQHGSRSTFLGGSSKYGKDRRFLAVWEGFEVASDNDVVMHLELYTDGSAISTRVPAQVVSARWGVWPWPGSAMDAEAFDALYLGQGRTDAALGKEIQVLTH